MGGSGVSVGTDDVALSAGGGSGVSVGTDDVMLSAEGGSGVSVGMDDVLSLGDVTFEGTSGVTEVGVGLGTAKQHDNVLL